MEKLYFSHGRQSYIAVVVIYPHHCRVASTDMNTAKEYLLRFGNGYYEDGDYIVICNFEYDVFKFHYDQFVNETGMALTVLQGDLLGMDANKQ